MTSSIIRCLLAILALSENYERIASKDIAYLLGIERPSAHRTLSILKEKKLIEQEPYGDVRFTYDGFELAKKLRECKDDLMLLFSMGYGLDINESIKAAILLMSELEEESINKLRMQIGLSDTGVHC